jgi:hypothetical protein
MVRKKNGKWWMCMKFIDLNKCYPKDDFPLARIDKIIDSATGCEMMALMDCFSRYIKYGSAKKMRRPDLSPPSTLFLS